MSKIFDSEKNINVLAKKFLKQLDGCISKCFKKNRSTKSGNNKIVKLYKKLHTSKKHENNIEVKNIEEEIANETIAKIMGETKGMDSETGGLNVGNMWKLKSKITPKVSNVPTAMKDSEGKLMTSKNDIQKETMEYYSYVLRNRNIKEGLENHKNEKEDLCEIRLEYTKSIKSPPWLRTDIIKAMKGLKAKKSRDPNNIANELFDPKVAGEDLIEAILKLMNRIKSDLIYPECLQLVNISSIYK